MIHRSSKVYVMGHFHIDTVESFEEGIGGAYHTLSLSAKYSQSYCDEYSLRYNRWNAGQPMFISLLEQASERAL